MTSREVLDTSRFVSVLAKAFDRASLPAKKYVWHLSSSTPGLRLRFGWGPNMAITFGWKRFWCVRGENINLSDGGYLADPDSEWARYLNPDLIPLERMNELNCVALLGEP